jgi:hypothetical protein
MTLSFPEHAWKERDIAFGVEVSIDHLPSKFEGRWREVVEAATHKWIEMKGAKKVATIWMWGTMSVNFPRNGLSWSEFVIPVGLPPSFLVYLCNELSKSFGHNVRFSEGVQLLRDDGWVAICHVQDGALWVEEDAGEWVAFRTDVVT